MNPGVPIFGLYGGIDSVDPSIDTLLDDLYAFSEQRDDAWKWRNGDRMIAAWYGDRGRQLAWDTIVVVQWDMLVLAPIAQVFAALSPGEMLLSGDRPIAEVETWWYWVRPDSKERPDYDAFRAHLVQCYGYRGDAFACLPIVVCLPRVFLERYLTIVEPDLGFFEYRVPTYARVFEIPVRREPGFFPWWQNDPSTQHLPPSRRILNAVGQDVHLRDVLAARATGRAAVFHPFRRSFPSWMASRSGAALGLALLKLGAV